jgi:hypothetical protein
MNPTLPSAVAVLSGLADCPQLLQLAVMPLTILAAVDLPLDSSATRRIRRSTIQALTRKPWPGSCDAADGGRQRWPRPGREWNQSRAG